MSWRGTRSKWRRGINRWKSIDVKWRRIGWKSAHLNLAGGWIQLNGENNRRSILIARRGSRRRGTRKPESSLTRCLSYLKRRKVVGSCSLMGNNRQKRRRSRKWNSVRGQRLWKAAHLSIRGYITWTACSESLRQTIWRGLWIPSSRGLRSRLRICSSASSRINDFLYILIKFAKKI
jgi:hypothetical protein